MLFFINVYLKMYVYIHCRILISNIYLYFDRLIVDVIIFTDFTKTIKYQNHKKSI